MTAPLAWFNSWKKTDWKVGSSREATAGRGRYRVLRRGDADFAYRPYTCPDTPWAEIGIATTQAAAIAIAQNHADTGGSDGSAK
jgi:hypothetical protein